MMVPTLVIISIITFIIIQAPPGDFLTSYIAAQEARGKMVDPAFEEAMRSRYGMDLPLYLQYFKWVKNIASGDLGYSFELQQPVNEIIMERLPYSLLISVISMLIVYGLGIPIGMLSAVKQYSVADYVFTIIGFIGLAIPNFLFALVMLWIIYSTTGTVSAGLFSSQFINQPMTLAKFIDLLNHLWLPALIVGTAGTAGVIRTMRANILDELGKPYVVVARAKGLRERLLLYKYPFRIALNPIISTVGWRLPALITGEILTSITLGLPTMAPIYLRALQHQDMYLASSIVFILTLLTLIGTLLSDLLLVLVDPRIRESM